MLTFKRAVLRVGAVSAMYWEWNATPELLTSLANICLPLSSLTNSDTRVAGPDTVTVSSEL